MMKITSLCIILYVFIAFDQFKQITSDITCCSDNEIDGVCNLQLIQFNFEIMTISLQQQDLTTLNATFLPHFGMERLYEQNELRPSSVYGPSIIGGVVGASLGAYAGGPFGSIVGAGVGLGVGGILGFEYGQKKLKMAQNNQNNTNI